MGEQGTATQANLDRVRAAWDAFAERPVTPAHLDDGRFDPLFEGFYADDVVLDMSEFESWPGAAIYEGSSAVRAFYREWIETWKELRFEIEAHFVLAPDAIASVITQRGIGKYSDAVVENRLVGVHTMVGGRARRVALLWPADEALARLRLRDS